MVLSKANMDVAFEYAHLCVRKKGSCNIYQIILWVGIDQGISSLMIEGMTELLAAENPYLKKVWITGCRSLTS